MKKRTFVVFGTILIVALSLISWSARSQQKNTPNKTISEFMQALSTKDRDIILFLTNEPPDVQKRVIEEFGRLSASSGLSKETNQTQNPLYLGISGVSSEAATIPLNGQELVKSFSAIPLFLEQKRFFRKINDLKVEGNEARARVSLGSNDSRGLADIEFDFFLFQDQGEWKIFAIKNPVLNEKYDLYKFFAQPRKPESNL